MDYNTRFDTATYRTERNGLQPNFNTNVKEKNKLHPKKLAHLQKQEIRKL